MRTCFSTNIGIPKGTNYVLLIDLFLFSDETNFIQELLKGKENSEQYSFNFNFRSAIYMI